MGCVAHRRVNDFGVEGRVAVRDMRVEGNPRTTAVTSVDLAGMFTAPTDVKILSVRRGGCPRAPMAGKGEAMLVIDYFGEGFGVGLLTDMPSSQAVELVKGSPWTRFGHLC